jgi:hypothetical protein
MVVGGTVVEGAVVEGTVDRVVVVTGLVVGGADVRAVLGAVDEGLVATTVLAVCLPAPVAAPMAPMAKNPTTVQQTT